jgi:hypothetical protein
VGADQRRTGTWNWMLRVGMLVIASVLPSSAFASSAHARSQPRLVVEAPNTVFIRSSVRVTGRAVAVPRSAHVALIARERGLWRLVARGSLVRPSAGVFALTFRAPKQRGSSRFEWRSRRDPWLSLPRVPRRCRSSRGHSSFPCRTLRPCRRPALPVLSSCMRGCPALKVRARAPRLAVRRCQGLRRLAR